MTNPALQETDPTGPAITVMICAHNPHRERLNRTLEGLRRQTLPARDWELILVDNQSSPPLGRTVDLAWHPRGRIVLEEKLGLTPARLRGFREAQSDLVVMVDDDNVLDENYLAASLKAFRDNPRLGAAGGKAIPEYEEAPPEWFPRVGISLACRDLGDRELTENWRDAGRADRVYPSISPVGAGMVLRRAVWEVYMEQLKGDPRRGALDRTGKSLVSGGDNDIVMTALNEGWDVGYLPALSLRHLIPRGRVQPEYLARLAEASFRSWVLVLDIHGLRPWKAIPAWAGPLLKARHYFRTRAWSGPEAYIRWRGVCGQISGRAMLR